MQTTHSGCAECAAYPTLHSGGRGISSEPCRDSGNLAHLAGAPLSGARWRWPLLPLTGGRRIVIVEAAAQERGATRDAASSRAEGQWRSRADAAHAQGRGELAPGGHLLPALERVEHAWFGFGLGFGLGFGKGVG